MAADPILVLQLHRMGDLILTFPLLMRLRQLWPHNPLWVAAEPAFFEQLMPLAPDVVFFPSSHCGVLAQRSYAAAINLSSSPTAAQTMAQLQSPLKLGPVANTTNLHVEGFWQLYRAALTQNNRANAFTGPICICLILRRIPTFLLWGTRALHPQERAAWGWCLGPARPPSARMPDFGRVLHCGWQQPI